MIEYLRIKDLAIIDELEVEFGRGLSVITGETGAGKSILVAGLSLLRGSRATSQMVRTGAEYALVEAVIRPDKTMASEKLFREAGISFTPELVIGRRISAGGRGRVRINGELTTVAALEQVVASLVDLTGQHDQQSLAVTSNHRVILDDYGVEPEKLERVDEAYRRVRATCRELDGMPIDPRERSAREDMLRHQLGELEAAKVRAGEEDELDAERRRLASVVDLETVSRDAVGRLYEGPDSVTDTLARAVRNLSKWSHVEPMLGDVAGKLEDARTLCEDGAHELRTYADDLESDPGRLEEIEERLLFLAGLKRKHGCAVLRALLDRFEEMKAELETLSAHEEKLGELLNRLSKERDELFLACKALSTARKAAARRLEKEVEGELRQLGMENTRFKIVVNERRAGKEDDDRLIHEGRQTGPAGWDAVEMMVSANPGEPLMSVSRIASGGELSRLLLAIKTVTAAGDTVTSYIFDEVDAGIGGPVGDVVGRKLAEVAKHRQVVCVTHLPQIAAYAQEHYVVEKTVSGGRTRSSIRRLKTDERIEVLGGMMSGSEEPTKNALKHAEELLERSGVLGDRKVGASDSKPRPNPKSQPKAQPKSQKHKEGSKKKHTVKR